MSPLKCVTTHLMKARNDAYVDEIDEICETSHAAESKLHLIYRGEARRRLGPMREFRQNE